MRKFYSKILLFGEYGVIVDAMGLNVPFKAFSGQLDFNQDKNNVVAQFSNNSLNSLCEYLKLEENNGSLETVFDLIRLKADIDKGLIFDSDIPQGYGVGSSGALCAAIYDEYGCEKIHPEGNMTENDILKLKTLFARMESFFHGISSGLDPLISYLERPLLVKNKNSIGYTNLPDDLKKIGVSVFLIDTKTTGKTEPLVNSFLDKLRHYSFYKKFNQEFIPANNLAIQYFIEGNSILFYKNLRKLSSFTQDHFKPMIPDNFEELWQTGLDSEKYYLKLCGSGGGGFLLGFTGDIEKVKGLMDERGLEMLVF